MSEHLTGRIHSFQSLGTVDGPGVRFVAFLQGCPLRCKCCHNPDTWDASGGKNYTAEDLLSRAVRCREYFGKDGGVTLSGGEPLLQAEFCLEFFRLCHDAGINTCLDTSGCVMNDSVRTLLSECDRVLLDVKYATDTLYRENVGCGIGGVLGFLSALDTAKVKTTLRQVVIPTKNDTEEGVRALLSLAERHPCVDRIELLPFRKICTVKYAQMGIPFPFEGIPEPSPERMALLKSLLGKYT